MQNDFKWVSIEEHESCSPIDTHLTLFGDMIHEMLSFLKFIKKVHTLFFSMCFDTWNNLENLYFGFVPLTKGDGKLRP